MKWLSVLLALALAPAALAGSADAQADVDVFHAGNQSSEFDSGAPEVLSAQELGLNLRLRVDELDDKLHFKAHYRGREPFGGEIQNTALRTLYELRADYEITSGVTATAGRFTVLGPTFLVVDGAQVSAELPWGFDASAFAGRRGLTGARREAGFDKFFLAAGAKAGFTHELVRAAVHFNFAQDEVIFLKDREAPDTVQPTGGVNLMVNAFSRFHEQIILGGQLSFVQQGNYVLGPTADTVELQVQALNLFNGMLFAQYRPLKLLRFSYDLHAQRPALVRTATFNGDDGELRPEIVDPNFIDNRLRVSGSPFGIGWIHAGVRHRLRPDRQELRYFGEIDINHLIPFGVYTKAQIIYEDLILNDAADGFENDRILGDLSVGYFGHGLDVGAGVSYIERSGGPISSRVAKAPAPQDLSPFVLAAQRVLFLRATYSARYWYTGLNLERSLVDNEVRVFAQVGGRLELDW